MDIFQREGANPPLPLALVGTTAGTGSEVSPVAVLTIDESGRKKAYPAPIAMRALPLQTLFIRTAHHSA